MGLKKKLSINLSFLTVTDSTEKQKPPKTFPEQNGVVGLRFVATLSDDFGKDSIFMNSTKNLSSAVPILGKKHSTSISMDEMELCEEYTCVISHLGENIIEKREYFEADLLGNKDEFVSDSVGSFVIADFLTSCFLCKKRLQGLDIFMYRGEKAFCSVECRDTQITIDEQAEKYKSGARKTIDYSVSPCSGALQFFAGVVAA